MHRPAAPSHRPLAQRAGVWLLLVALLVYGYSGALLKVLGPVHRHESVVVAISVPVAGPLDQLLRQVQAWRDKVHADSHTGHATGLFVHSHSHSDFERHHHDSGDASVVSLDAPGALSEAVSDGVAAAAIGSAMLALGLGFTLALPAPAVRAQPWPQARALAWVSASTRLLERPPRA